MLSALEYRRDKFIKAHCILTVLVLSWTPSIIDEWSTVQYRMSHLNSAILFAQFDTEVRIINLSHHSIAASKGASWIKLLHLVQTLMIVPILHVGNLHWNI